MNIGKLKKTDTGFIGHISTFDLEIGFHLSTNDHKRTNFKAPDYFAFAKNASGRDVQVGVVWKRFINASNGTGEPFFSMTFDDPSFTKALNVAAFKAEEDSVWDIQWRRRQNRNIEPDDA